MPAPDAPDFSLIRGPLERMQDEALSRRERDFSRRMVLKWLKGRGFDLRENQQGTIYIGRWDDPDTDSGQFHPEFEALSDGCLRVWEEPKDEGEDEDEGPVRMPTGLRDAARSRVRDGVEAARGKPDELASLMGLLSRMDDASWVRSESWDDYLEVFAPALARLRELGGEAIVACVREWPAESLAAPFLVILLEGWAKQQPSWVPPPEVAEFLFEFRSHDEHDEAWELSFQLAARGGAQTDAPLRRIMLRRGALWSDINWGTGVNDARTDAGARGLVVDAFDTWRERGRYDFVEIIAGGFLDHGGPEDVERPLGATREGVAKGVDMRDSWDTAVELRKRGQPDPVAERLRAAGIDPERFGSGVKFAGLLGHWSDLNLATGEVRSARPDEEAGGREGLRGPVTEAPWWRIHGAEDGEYRAWLRSFAADLPAGELRDRIAQAAESECFLRNAMDALLGHPPIHGWASWRPGRRSSGRSSSAPRRRRWRPWRRIGRGAWGRLWSPRRRAVGPADSLRRGRGQALPDACRG